MSRPVSNASVSRWRAIEVASINEEPHRVITRVKAGYDASAEVTDYHAWPRPRRKFVAGHAKLTDRNDRRRVGAKSDFDEIPGLVRYRPPGRVVSPATLSREPVGLRSTPLGKTPKVCPSSSAGSSGFRQHHRAIPVDRRPSGRFVKWQSGQVA